MKRFKTVHYTIHSNKIKDARGIRFAVIADLHGMEFGSDNRKLLETIHRYRPDGILIAGDMIVRNDSASLKTASSLLRSLAQQYPVYYALGNHEYKLYKTDPQENCMAARYQEYEKELKKAGIHILHNESCSLQVGKTSLTVYGLLAPLLDLLLNDGEVRESQFRIDDFNVGRRIHFAGHVNNVVVLKAADDVGNGVALTDVGEELIAQAFALARAGNQTGDVDEFDSSRNDFLGVVDFGERLQTRIRNLDDAHIGINCAEGVILSGDARFRQSIEKR